MSRTLKRLLIAFALCAIGLPAQAAENKLQLKKGDHICYIGNTLADRMQHHGWLETFIQQRYPKLELVFRNLGFSADELTVRPRSKNFGSPDSHLAHSRADVIFAFFGYNESFGGEAGLPKFRKDLVDFIDHTLKQKYNNKSAPRLVLFSPIAHENLHDPHLPDGKENNARLALYTQTMAQVAGEKKIPFIDLFTATRKLYPNAKRPLTINGIHLTLEGNRLVGQVMDEALFGPAPRRTPAQLEKIRIAVLDKNLHWFNRYRTTDGYNVYGGRARAGKGPDGLDNFAVMQREMQILDVMTANRDRRIWAIANGGDLAIDDSNAPPPLRPRTNRPGKGKGGTYPFLGGKEAIKKMKIAKGLSVNLFASEEQFPELINPVQMSFDTNGRLWVAAWPTYPHWNPTKPLNDKLLILPDEDGDGKADKCIVFADELHNPTGFEFWNGGVLVAQAPDILFLKDTDGDDRADVRIRVLHGIDSADTHHTANSFIFGPAGHLYFQRGVFHVTNIESPWGKPFRSTSTGMYRYDVLKHQVFKHFGMGPNPHGNVFDRWGYQFATDGTSGNGFYVGYPGKGTPGTLYRKRVRPVPGIGILSSEHFPRANQGNLLICNVIGFQGVAQYRFVDQGAGFHAEEIEPIVSSSDPNFRPSSVEVGGDGALYVLDWQNPLIGHLQHNIRDPNRDHLHGRVYRFTANGRPLMKPVKMAGKPIEEVLKHLSSPTDGVRYRVRLELSGRDSKQVVAAVQKWAADLDPSKQEDAQKLVEALWLHQQHRIVNPELLKRVLRSVEPHARAAGTRVLADWSNQIKDGGKLLVQAARDEHPRVRAEAVVAAASYQGPEAAEVIFEVEMRPTDEQLRYNLNATRGVVNVSRYLDDARKAGRKLSLAAQTYMLRNANVADLLKLKRTEAVYRAILTRPKVPARYLKESLSGLAKLKKVDEFKVLLDVMEELDTRKQGSKLASLGQLLILQPAEKLRSAKERVKKLALAGNELETRRAAFAAWVLAEGTPDDVVKEALGDKARFRTFLNAVPQIPDEKLRSQLYSHLRPLLSKMPEHLQEDSADGLRKQGIQVDYFEPNPSDVAMETLAKLKPRASGIVPQIKMDVPQLKRRDAFALRFTGSLQIERSGRYTFFLSSDDGSRLYIGKKLVINNDGLHGMKMKKGTIHLHPGLHPLVVTYFDNGGGDGLSLHWSGPGIQKQPIGRKYLSVGGADTLADLVIRTFSSIPGHEAEQFLDLAKLIKAGKHRSSAVHALLQIPPKHWAKQEILPLAESLARHISTLPAKYRTSEGALEAMRAVDALASLLPKERAREFQAKVAELRVRIIRIGTVPHRMIYDKVRVFVQAGKPVEFILSNTDNMPHNFAVVQPGAMKEIGELAEATAQAPDAMDRHYVPKSPKVLVSSRLLQSGEKQALSFEVPSTPGVYPYVCTYPGHWRRMYGALYVVKDLQAYLANPTDYLAKHPLPIQDSLLKYSTKGKEWKFEDLASAIKPLQKGRSFEVGKHVFRLSNCVACHRLNNEGQQIGPDLSKLDIKRRMPEVILTSILQPSREIEEKYQSYTFFLTSGKVVTGMIVKETPRTVEVLTDPLAKKAPLVLKKSAIGKRAKSKKSIMPEGMLDKLSREEILDLIAYIVAGGKEKHPLFHKHQHKK